MKILLSPAKTFAKEVPAGLKMTEPLFAKETKDLIKALQDWHPNDFQEIMSVSQNIACLNHERYQGWENQPTHPALAYFKGDVYRGLAVEDFSQSDWDYALQHVFMLSGLYGLLRSGDGIKNYRLEMGTSWGGDHHQNLYEIWQPRVAKALNQLNDSPLINLASNEYWKAVDTSQINTLVITPVFKEKKNDQYKIIAIHAKKARGLMARYAVKNKITDPEALKQFDLDGYHFDENLSTESEWLFVRH